MGKTFAHGDDRLARALAAGQQQNWRLHRGSPRAQIGGDHDDRPCRSTPPGASAEPSERKRVLAEIVEMPVYSWEEQIIDEELSDEDAEKDRIFFETIANA